MSAPISASELLERVKFGTDGLVPAIVQDAGSGRVLTQAWMNRESLGLTLERGETWFWSRSRQELWHKGATSGNTQSVRGVILDCDGDSLVVLVDAAGPACHTGHPTCYFTPVDAAPGEPFAAIADLVRTVAARAAEADPESSYTSRLLAKGIDTVCKKVGEEATEVVIAAKGREHGQVVYESADLLYHLSVLWRASGVEFEEIAAELASRRPPA